MILWGVVWGPWVMASPSSAPAGTCSGRWWRLPGTAASFFIGTRYRALGARPFDWRYLATIFAVFAFIVALFTIIPPRNDMQVSAFFPQLVGLSYVLIGIWTRTIRILFLGVAVAALSLVGFFYLPHYFLLWMAVVGGGGLILGGLWLRSV